MRVDDMDKPVYTLIFRTVQVANGMYLYSYLLDTEIFETEEAAQVRAYELNNT